MGYKEERKIWRYVEEEYIVLRIVGELMFGSHFYAFTTVSLAVQASNFL